MEASGPARAPARAWFAAILCMLGIAAGAAGAGCSGGGRTPPSGDETGDVGAASTLSAAPEVGPDTAPPAEMLLLFPSAADDLLHVERRPAVEIAAPEQRAAQVLGELFRGPGPGLLAAVPDGVRLRQLYLFEDGTAWVDLSSPINKVGGSTAELQVIYAIVDTLALNVPEVRRAGFLVEGQPRDTLAGHVSIARPFTPDFRYVEPSARPGGQEENAAPAEPSESEPKDTVEPGAPGPSDATGDSSGRATGDEDGSPR